MTLNRLAQIDQYLVQTAEILPLSKTEVGGKAYQLAQLVNAGYQVPDFLVLPHDILQQLLVLEQVDLQKIAARIVAKFPQGSVFAVRSSANLEDGQTQSFAGLFTSKIGVKGEDLIAAITEVFNSARAPEVREYCQINGLADQTIKLSVIVQILVPADSAGVAFGVHPVSGDRDVIYIAAISGLGEALVNGEMSGDIYTIGGEENSKIFVQSEKDVWEESSGKMIREKMPRPRIQPVLDLGKRNKVALLLKNLQEEFESYLDIEFAFHKEELFLLQARPITTLSSLPNTSAQRLLWDNSNIVESYPGLTKPLTFSFIGKVYGAVYMELAKVMGMSQKLIAQERNAFQQMLGLIKGRVYYNLYNWYGLLSMLPGYAINAEYMEKMMGVKEKLEAPKVKMSKWQAWPQMIWAIISMLWSLVTLPSKRKSFQRYIDQYIQDEKKIELGELKPVEILMRYQQTERILTKRWQAPLLNDFFTMIFFGLTDKLCKKYFPNDPQLQNDLLANSQDIISTQPYWRLMDICGSIRKDEELLNLFTGSESTFIWDKITGLEIQESILSYIDQFGDRISEELKLETITYRQNPLLLILRIQALLNTKLLPKSNKEEETRMAAEAKVKSEIRNPWRRFLFFKILNITRAMVSGRENLRFERTRVFALIRSYFLAIGKQWKREGLLEEERAIFYLTIEEVSHYINGTASIPELLPLVNLQKQNYERYAQETSPAARCHSYGAVQQHDPIAVAPTVVGSLDELQGLGCSRGRVEAKVLIVDDPTQVSALNGEILVARFTDPGWVTLFPGAKGILVERGSLLSHSAIVSRELGLPCIVQIDNLLSTLETGDVVEMDGSTGAIFIKAKNSTARPALSA